MTSVAVSCILLLALLAGAGAQEPALAPYSGIYDAGNKALQSGLCITGRMQSPVFLDSTGQSAGVTLNTVADSVTVNFSTSATVNVTNEDKDTPQMNVPAGSTAQLEFLGNTWTAQLIQIHWHHSSEHRLDNVSYDAEAHLVTRIVQSGKLAVLSYFLEVGDTADPALEIALQYKPTNFTTVNETHRVWEPMDVPNPVNLQTLFEPFITGAFATYEGSLTTPPCTEGVEWIVMLQPQSLTANQLTELQTYIQEGNGPAGENVNEREDQPLNGRIVQIVSPPQTQTGG